MPHGITQCYLPPGRGDIPALTPAEAGTRLSDPGGMHGWVDLVLRLGYATGGARAQKSWGLRQRLVATLTEIIPHSVVYCATDQCRERLKACINAEGGHSEHLLAWHSSCHRSQQVFVRATDNPQLALYRAKVRKKATNLQLDEKFCSSQVSVATFSGGVGKSITVYVLER